MSTGSGNRAAILLFAGAALLFSVFTLLTFDAGLAGDEGRYMLYASNLAGGYFSPPDAPSLANGPGYPMMLFAFETIGLGARASIVLNPLLLAASCTLVYLSARNLCGRRTALATALLFAAYAPAWIYLPVYLTEVPAVFFSSLAAYLVVRGLRSGDPRDAIGAGLAFCWLVLVKVFLVYVLYAGILLLAACALPRRRPKTVVRQLALFAGTAFVLSHAYLVYTESVAGRVPYWTDHGGSPLFFMTAPGEGELGDWEAVSSHYPEVYLRLAELTDIQADSAYRAMAIANLRADPATYLVHWANNVSRIFLNYPYTATPQKLSTLFYIVPNMLILSVLLLVLPPFARHLRRIPPSILTLAALSILYVFGATLVSTYSRMLLPAIPWIALVLGWSLSHLVTIRFRDPSAEP